MRPANSLTFRSLVLTTGWFVIAIVVIAVVISTLYRNAAERSFRKLLEAETFNVVNSVSVDENGKLQGSPQLGNLNYQKPGQGWYWTVEPLYNGPKDKLTSPSLGGAILDKKDTQSVPLGKDFRRTYVIKDYNGNDLSVLETVVSMDEKDRRILIKVTGNRQAIRDEVRWFSRRLYAALALFGIASVLVNGIVILWALHPLDLARRALRQISENGEGEMRGTFPDEIQPLADEINGLLANNRAIIERARMQVGNLAHSLKTPIAVLLNEAQSLNDSGGKLIASQIALMQAQVQAYLNRARIAAQTQSVLTRCEIDPTLKRLVRVMRRLNPETRFDVKIAPGLIVATEQQDLEEVVGNLLENAARFARSKVRLTACRVDADDLDGDWIEITVEDDGPGLSPDEINRAMKRGQRLDESASGSGLGLSIVDDIVQAYGGTFSLKGMKGEGLLARLQLPAKGKAKKGRTM